MKVGRMALSADLAKVRDIPQTQGNRQRSVVVKASGL